MTRDPGSPDQLPARSSPRSAALRWILLLLPLAAILLHAYHFHRYRTIAASGILETLDLPSLPYTPGHQDETTPSRAGDLTPDQRLVLYGDRSRSSTVERAKAIWDRWPTNLVYMHNYISSLTEHAGYWCHETNGASLACFTNEIAHLQARDPGNARFNYLAAGYLLNAAVTGAWQTVTNGGTILLTATIVDTDRFTRAIALFQEGLGKPSYKRYTRELAAERLAILGKPRTLIQQIGQIGLMAGVLLPDLAPIRTMARAASLHVNRLIDEGRGDEARAFLSLWRRYVPQTNHDSFTLIDVLVEGAVAEIAAVQIPQAYRRLGDLQEAQVAALETSAIAQPIRTWRALLHKPAQEEERRIRLQGGILANLLIPALNERPSDRELEPSRRLEYALADQGAAIAAANTLCGLALLMIVLAGYYRWRNKAPLPELTSLAPLSDWLRLALTAILLPILVFLAITRWSPWSARQYGAGVALPQLITQYLALAFAVGLLIWAKVSRWLQRGGRVPAPPPAPGRWIWSATILAIVLSLLPGRWLLTGEGIGPGWLAHLPSGIAALMALATLACMTVGIVKRAVFRGRFAAYYGLQAKALVPALALASIGLGGIIPAIARHEERYWLGQDTLLCIDPSGGFTSIEIRAVHRLKADMEHAAEAVLPDSPNESLQSK